MKSHHMSLVAFLLVFVLGLGVPVQAETFIVTTTDDSGPGSLREQIAAANATPEKDTLTFDVAGTIRLASPLPQITQPLEMNGEGAIEIDGSELDPGVFALDIQHTSECVIEGMTIRNFRGDGSGAIRVQGDAFDSVIANNILVGNLWGIGIVEGPSDAGNNRIEGNYIDAEVGPLAPVPGEWRRIGDLNTYGIRLLAASGNVVAENWVSRSYLGISIAGDPSRPDGSQSGYTPGEANANEVTRNRIFFAGNQGLGISLGASDNMVAANEVYYASREAILVFGDTEVLGNLGRVAHRNVVADNVIIGGGYNDPRVGVIVVGGNTDENIVVRNRISNSSAHGIMVWEHAQRNIFQENVVDGADGYGLILVSGAIYYPALPGNGPMVDNRFEQNVVSNALGAVSVQGDAVGNVFRENVFGPQKDSVVVRVDGNQTPETPDRVAANNRFEKNVYTDVKGRV